MARNKSYTSAFWQVSVRHKTKQLKPEYLQLSFDNRDAMCDTVRELRKNPDLEVFSYVEGASMFSRAKEALEITEIYFN